MRINSAFSLKDALNLEGIDTLQRNDQQLTIIDILVYRSLPVKPAGYYSDLILRVKRGTYE